MSYAKRIGKLPRVKKTKLVSKKLQNGLSRVPVGRAEAQVIADMVMFELGWPSLQVIFDKRDHRVKKTGMTYGSFNWVKRTLILYRSGQNMNTFTHEMAHAKPTSAALKSDKRHNNWFEKRWLRVIDITFQLLYLK